MKNFVTSETSGSKFEIKINLPYGIKGGANYSKVIIAGEERHANWFVQDNGDLRCLCSFDMDGQLCKMQGVATIDDNELNSWVAKKNENKKAESQRESDYRLSQEFGY